MFSEGLTSLDSDKDMIIGQQQGGREQVGSKVWDPEGLGGGAS